jgi:biotin-dependent carboxylase-like uncharacterized protein
MRVIHYGLRTLVVDLGRFGLYAEGLPPSGAMDRFSFRVGNILLGNDENVAGLECCFVGPTLEVMENACMVFTGAEVDPRINDEIVPMWQVHRVKPGDLISFGHLKSGVYFYICFSGGIDVPIVYGSRTTNLQVGIGGYEGRPLRNGDTLRLFPPTTHFSMVEGRRLEDKYIPKFSNRYEVRTVFGLSKDLVYNLDEFTEATFELSPQFGRIGNRYYSSEFKYRWTLDVRNEPQPLGAGDERCNTPPRPYPIGSIQADAMNGAIVLLQDGVNKGCFLCFAVLVEPDMDIVGQNRPRDKVKFVSVSQEQALSIRKGEYIRLNRIRESCLKF